MTSHDLQLTAADGYKLEATLYSPPLGQQVTAGVVLNSATGVHRRFYARFATFLAEHCGYAVLTYDFRGIGGSRPRDFRTFSARLRDWPLLDMPAAIAWMQEQINPPRVLLIGHSAGGNLIGLIPNLRTIDAVVLVCAQLGYWRLWPASVRYALAATWYFAVPVLSRLFGYVPGWLGAGQHWPRGIAVELARWCRHPDYLFGDPSLDTHRYAEFDAPMLAMTFSDDPHATLAASEHLLMRFPRARITRRHVEPAEVGAQRIGHFGFFRPYCESLWKECVRWLEAAPGTTDSGRQSEEHERSNRHREASHDKRAHSRRRSVLARGSRT